MSLPVCEWGTILGTVGTCPGIMASKYSVHSNYIPVSSHPTGVLFIVGIDYRTKPLQVEGVPVELKIWLVSVYYKRAYSITENIVVDWWIIIFLFLGV